MSAAAIDDHGAFAEFFQFLHGVAVAGRRMHGVDNMTFTIILVFAHINDNGIVMIEHACGFTRADFIDAAEALPQLTLGIQFIYRDMPRVIEDVSKAAAVLYFTGDADDVARLSGDEFAVLMPDANEGDAQQLSERIVRGIAQIPFRFEGSNLRLTTSLGIGLYSEHGQSVEELVAEGRFREAQFVN